MAGLVTTVCELRIDTSLAGFDALLRSKPVIVHGVQYYAGAGATSDLGSIPASCAAGSTRDEWMAAALLLCPRYIAPEAGLSYPTKALAERQAHRIPKVGPAASIVLVFRQEVGHINRMFVK